MRFELTPNFSKKYTMRYVCSTQSGLNRMVIVPLANPTNRALRNCSAFLHRPNTVRLPDQTPKDSIKYESKH